MEQPSGFQHETMVWTVALNETWNIRIEKKILFDSLRNVVAIAYKQEKIEPCSMLQKIEPCGTLQRTDAGWEKLFPKLTR